MCHDVILDDKIFELLAAEDARIAAAVHAAGCRECGGRLDRADYPRKPRGGELGVAGETLSRRRSFCCCRDGCRRRATPPSLVFLGRRVYLGVVVLVETLRLAAGMARKWTASPPPQTVRRWRTWFAALRSSPWWTRTAGQVWPPVEPAEVLPEALISRLKAGGRSCGDVLVMTLQLLSPLTTTATRS